MEITPEQEENARKQLGETKLGRELMVVLDEPAFVGKREQFAKMLLVGASAMIDDLTKGIKPDELGNIVIPAARFAAVDEALGRNIEAIQIASMMADLAAMGIPPELLGL
jgi:hypothetical protein